MPGARASCDFNILHLGLLICAPTYSAECVGSKREQLREQLRDKDGVSTGFKLSSAVYYTQCHYAKSFGRESKSCMLQFSSAIQSLIKMKQINDDFLVNIAVVLWSRKLET